MIYSSTVQQAKFRIWKIERIGVKSAAVTVASTAKIVVSRSVGLKRHTMWQWSRIIWTAIVVQMRLLLEFPVECVSTADSSRNKINLFSRPTLFRFTQTIDVSTNSNTTKGIFLSTRSNEKLNYFTVNLLLSKAVPR